MNENMIQKQELELVRRGLGDWGKVVPELFTFGKGNSGRMVRHG